MENDNPNVLLLLGEIKGQMAGFIIAQAASDRRLNDHEGRIRVLETTSNKSKGVIAGITIAASTVASAVGFLAHLLFGK